MIKGSANLYITNVYDIVVLTDQIMNAIGNFDDVHHLLVGDLNSQNPICGF